MSTARARLLDLGAMREVVRVSVPLMFGMVGNLVLMLVDRICLARYSQDALKASGPAVFTATTVIMVTTGAVGITRSYVAQAHGRGDERGALDEGVNGFVLGLLLSALLLAATPLLTRVPQLSGQPAHIETLEAQFLGLSPLYGSVMTLNMALSSYFNGMGRTRIPMTVGIMCGRSSPPSRRRWRRCACGASGAPSPARRTGSTQAVRSGRPPDASAQPVAGAAPFTARSDGRHFGGVLVERRSPCHYFCTTSLPKIRQSAVG
ncbi:MATE family efflux transporter [Streptomyces sp. NPDC007205]|uniref:MATE family efflux transporter n=1 Tax=Streptomyces sp. NPDC007205 TaxID=3154316 RepID=UPI0033E53D32